LGHKVHPTGFRLGVIKDWQSKWYSDTSYADFVHEDNRLREEIKSKYREAAISLIEIDRQAKDVTIILHTARPGIVIGRGGQRVDEMKAYLESLIGKRIRLNIQEVRQPELDAYLVARSVAEQIERRIAYRRAMRQAMFRTIQAGAMGIKISVAGRLGGAEIARRQTAHEGRVPLHTLRADIDYGFTEAHTTMGRIGIKVWIYKGQVLPEAKPVETEEAPVEEIPEASLAVEKEERPAEIPAGEVATAGPAEKPARPKAAATEKEAEKKPRPRAKKTATPATGKDIKKDAAKPTVKRRRKATTAAGAESRASKPAADATEKEPSNKKEGETQDAAA
jgi:small subunit ribosomal protein S3